MRTRLGTGLALVFLAAGLGRADDRGQAQALLGQAVRAHGGESRLAKAQQLQRTGKGTMLFFGRESPFTVDTTLQLPDRLRDVIDLEVGGQKSRMILVVNGDKGWQTTPAGILELDKERLAELREEVYVTWLTTLLPLKDGKDFVFTSLPEDKVGGRALVGFKVSAKGHPDVSLYFDKQTDLLVKITRQARQAGLTIRKDYLYSDHKDFDGVKLATRYAELLNGTKSVELVITAYKFPERLDPRLFEKP